jgi:hypothetical protein
MDTGRNRWPKTFNGDASQSANSRRRCLFRDLENSRGLITLLGCNLRYAPGGEML